MAETQEELRAKLQAIEDRLRAVEARLEAEAAQRRSTMRDSRRCPACSGTRILHADRFQWITARGLRSMGRVELLICASCGHGEVQVADAASLEGQRGVRLLEPPPQGEGPYR